MAHYALLDENNIVVQVITGRNEDEVVDGISDWEEYYSQETGYKAVRTSYNTIGNSHRNNGTPFRVNYAVIGGRFDPTVEPDGAFIPPMENDDFTSWTLNPTTYLWEPPVPMPADGYPDENGYFVKYAWHEPEQAWVNVEERLDLYTPGEPNPEDA